mmetsp:Transcript_36939/g.56572  ORF Transcript_36939/g.56572 Transcript_36939/m.56572 type:complete len:120 (-) Transcript_36939:16-375(-)
MAETGFMSDRKSMAYAPSSKDKLDFFRMNNKHSVLSVKHSKLSEDLKNFARVKSPHQDRYDRGKQQKRVLEIQGSNFLSRKGSKESNNCFSSRNLEEKLISPRRDALSVQASRKQSMIR